jgi:hypothetical protein
MTNDDDAPPTATEGAGDAHLLGFSDEILLHILSHVPSTDLVLNVRRTCRKLATLCLDKSLVHTVLLQKDYQVRPCGAGGLKMTQTLSREQEEGPPHTDCSWLQCPMVEKWLIWGRRTQVRWT